MFPISDQCAGHLWAPSNDAVTCALLLIITQPIDQLLMLPLNHLKDIEVNRYLFVINY